MEWISVEKGLPALNEEVLVVTDNGYYGILWRMFDMSIGADGKRGGAKWVGDIYTTVTHWMPLPPPPSKV